MKIKLNFEKQIPSCSNHWGSMTHICVSKLTIIGLDNGLPPELRQAIILNQCGNIVNWTLRNKLQWNLKEDSYIFIQENAFESVVCEIVAILSRRQCVIGQSHTFISLLQVYYDLYEQDKVRYEEELQQLSGRDATSSLPPPAGGSIVDVVEGHQRNPGLDAALLLMDPSLIKTEPMSIPWSCYKQHYRARRTQNFVTCMSYKMWHFSAQTKCRI